MKLTLIMATTLAAAAFAQPPGPGGPPAQPPNTEIKAYLGLTDAQVTGLQSVRTQLNSALSANRQQIQSKQTDLENLLAKGTTDAAAVGKLVLDISNLRKQVDATTASFRDQARNLLTADQKKKLAALEDAAKLQPDIQEAAGLLLVAPPAPPAGKQGLFGPGGFGGPRDFGAMRPGGPGRGLAPRSYGGPRE